MEVKDFFILGLVLGEIGEIGLWENIEIIVIIFEGYLNVGIFFDVGVYGVVIEEKDFVVWDVVIDGLLSIWERW